MDIEFVLQNILWPQLIMYCKKLARLSILPEPANYRQGFSQPGIHSKCRLLAFLQLVN
jgi:hypothetical protein